MGILFSNIKVKWTRYSAQKLFLSRCFNFVCGYLPYIKEWLIWKNNLKYIFFFICKSSKMTILFKKWIWLVVLLFALRFQVIFYIEVKYQFHKSYIAYPVYHLLWKQTLRAPVIWPCVLLILKWVQCMSVAGFVRLNLESHNHFQNIFRVFDVLPSFTFTTSERMWENYLQVLQFFTSIPWGVLPSRNFADFATIFSIFFVLEF